MNDHGHLTRLLLLCGQCNCGCPEVLIDNGASPERRVVITDDFGQQVQMSLDQFQVLVEEARAGRLDETLATLSASLRPERPAGHAVVPGSGLYLAPSCPSARVPAGQDRTRRATAAEAS